MKKTYKVLLIAIIITSVVIGFTINSHVNANTNCDIKSISQELSSTLQSWIIKNEAQYYKNITVKITPTKVAIKNGKAEGVFNITVSEMLKATVPEELPAIRGMERFRNSEKGRLSPNKLNAVNKELNSWITELKGYIGKTETLNMGFKVTANVSKRGNVLPETVIFYMEDAQGGFYKIDRLVQTANQMEEEGFNHAKEIAGKAKNATPNNFVVDTYRRCDLDHPPLPKPNDPKKTRYYTQYNDYYNYAANYADSFALDYNTSYHTCSNDCANFVSQAMYAGGIPMDSIHDVAHWWCNPPNAPMDWSPWIYTEPVSENNYTGLKNYMINHNHWELSNITWANAGSVIFWKNSSNYPGHVAMVVQNDTVNRALSQHNTDKRHYLYTTDGYYKYNCDFYTVHNYVSYNSYSH